MPCSFGVHVSGTTKDPCARAVFSSIFPGILALLALALLMVGMARPVQAQPFEPQPFGAPGGVQPLDRLLPGIRRTHPGEFYDAEGPTYGPSGDPHYHLKWMTPDGRVIWFDADARNGRVLARFAGARQLSTIIALKANRNGGFARPLYGSLSALHADPYDQAHGGRAMHNFGPGPGVC